MDFQMEARASLILELKTGEAQPVITGSQVSLGLSDNLDKKLYVGADDMPNFNGINVIARTFIQGILTNIANSHQRGLWKNTEHIQFIMDELERGFAAVIENAKPIDDAPKNPIINFSFDGLDFKSPKFNKGKAIYNITGIDPEKSLMFIEVGSEDKPVWADDTEYELAEGMNLYIVHKDNINES